MHRHTPPEVRYRKFSNAVATIGGAKDGKKSIILLNRQHLPVAQRPTSWRVIARKQNDFSDEWFRHTNMISLLAVRKNPRRCRRRKYFPTILIIINLRNTQSKPDINNDMCVALRKPSPPPPFSLRPAAPPDEVFLLRLYASVRIEELAGVVWSDQQRTDFIRSQYHARRTDYARNFTAAHRSVIVINGKEAGMCIIWRSPDQLRLVAIELLPEYRSRGVGSALIRDLIQEADSARLPLTLSVHDTNHRATSLYRKLGFTLVAMEHGYLKMKRQSRFN
jgi:ribosomal protein S18 acetylase RimI-like enzyme